MRFPHHEATIWISASWPQAGTGFREHALVDEASSATMGGGGSVETSGTKAAMKQGAESPQLTVTRVRAALAGDADAVAQLVDTITPIVQARVARALLRRPHARRDVRQEVADLTQDVFVALFSDDAKALRAWDPARGLSLLNFVGLLAERRVASLMRIKHHAAWLQEAAADTIEEGPLTAATDAPESLVMSRLTVEHLLEALRASLSPRGLELFYRLYVDEQSVEDVCAATGLNVGAVYQWKRRLGRAARTALAELQGADAGSASYGADEEFEGLHELARDEDRS